MKRCLFTVLLWRQHFRQKNLCATRLALRTAWQNPSSANLCVAASNVHQLARLVHLFTVVAPSGNHGFTYLPGVNVVFGSSKCCFRADFCLDAYNRLCAQQTFACLFPRHAFNVAAYTRTHAVASIVSARSSRRCALVCMFAWGRFKKLDQYGQFRFSGFSLIPFVF